VTNLVEVDVHALQLEVRGTVVAVRQSASGPNVVRKRRGSQRTHQNHQGRARRRWSARRRHRLGYPVYVVRHVVLGVNGSSFQVGIRIGRSGGGPVGERR
jgi:hypothetical protein